MTLDSLPKGTPATITQINATKALKNRFNSFGLIKGEQVTVEALTLAKQTLKIRINNTRIALRISEAQKIEVSQ
ncbi:MAG: ferrous iron transport protein A [Methylococcales bacterium]|jgi:ferrous iron transport protein A|nr:ferrous iron transport protein A [Methylococcales bacterium]MBT7444564.1 ferrous iron transport protein A [Methylococcales bacterium]